MTHDLLKDVLEATGAALVEIRITALEDGVFYAVLVFASGVEVSARPSDAIALALRAGVPIYGADSVLDEAGIELPDEEPTGPNVDDGQPQVASDVELKQFREFLDQVRPEDFE
jgi:bifunctional DNase/RNase